MRRQWDLSHHKRPQADLRGYRGANCGAFLLSNSRRIIGENSDLRSTFIKKLMPLPFSVVTGSDTLLQTETAIGSERRQI
jgi:hypothetical protein